MDNKCFNHAKCTMQQFMPSLILVYWTGIVLQSLVRSCDICLDNSICSGSLTLMWGFPSLKGPADEESGPLKFCLMSLPLPSPNFC